MRKLELPMEKYVVNYFIEDDKIVVANNVGETRKIKKNKTNQKKINQAIVKNKITIAQKINDYEESSKERLIVLISNCLMLSISGLFIPFSFFTGFWLFFILSILCFSICVIATSTSGIEYYILVKNISNLKEAIGQKEKMEFKLPNFITKTFKLHN